MKVTALTPTDAPAQEAATRERIAQAAREFESMFMLQMLRQMRQSMLDDGEEKGLGAGAMTDTLDVELARQLSGQPGGLTPLLIQAMSAQAGLHPAATVPAIQQPAAITQGAKVANAGAPVAHTVASALERPATRGAGVSSAFGWRSDPFTGAERFHAGVDIRAAYGKEVPSAAAGRVVFAGTAGGYGQSVVIEHDGGVQTRYAHLSQIDVVQGDRVEAGATIGRVGQSGRATGPHLHFEVRDHGRVVDPTQDSASLRVALKNHAAVSITPRDRFAVQRDGVSGVNHED